MNAQTRIGLALAGIAVLIAGALLLRLVLDEPSRAPKQPSSTASTGATSQTAQGGSGTAKQSVRASKSGDIPLLRAGTKRRITVERGEIVRFRAYSPSGDELHVHGYELRVKLPAGETVSRKFKATIDGVFVIELHRTEEQVAELRVNPR